MSDRCHDRPAPGWLAEGLRAARLEVDSWPRWKRIAMRVEEDGMHRSDEDERRARHRAMAAAPMQEQKPDTAADAAGGESG